MVDGKSAFIVATSVGTPILFSILLVKSVKDEQKSESDSGTQGCDGKCQTVHKSYQHYLMYHFH